MDRWLHVNCIRSCVSNVTSSSSSSSSSSVTRLVGVQNFLDSVNYKVFFGVCLVLFIIIFFYNYLILLLLLFCYHEIRMCVSIVKKVELGSNARMKVHNNNNYYYYYLYCCFYYHYHQLTECTRTYHSACAMTQSCPMHHPFHCPLHLCPCPSVHCCCLCLYCCYSFCFYCWFY